jgi:thioester reductase-like protein
MLSVITELDQRISETPDKLLFAFLDIRGNIKESYTYRSFGERTNDIALHIQRNYLIAGDRILLAYEPGIEMIAAFFACVRLGLIPVPVYPPAANGLEASVQKMNFIAADCSAKAVLTDRLCYWSCKMNFARSSSLVSELEWIVTEDAEAAKENHLPAKHNEILFIQYTSGSTSEPKGVVVTHKNVLHNCNNVVDHLPIGVSWLPQYHDMGFIGYYLFFALKGGTTYGFSPADFIQRPALWLEAISKFRASASSAPNFAYEYCLLPGKIPESTLAHLDLSSLRFLMTAAEPIQPDAYRNFINKFSEYGLKAESYFGAYGLAEFTLAVSNYGRRSLVLDAGALKKNQVKIRTEGTENTQELMSCGRPLNDTEIRIVDPGLKSEVTGGEVGEVWLKGNSKCKGYWNQPGLTREIFEARLSESESNETWLRTGDLGFIFEGELFVCGRIKDMIILRGLNYYPQDIEAVAEKNPLLRKGCTVAFMDEGSGALVLVAGVKNPTRIPDARELQREIQRLCGISVSEFVFVPARTIAKTSSGKIRRFYCKEKYLKQQLQEISRISMFHEEITSAGERDSGRDILFNRYNLTGAESAALGRAGLDSIKIAEFGQDLKMYLEQKGFNDLSGEVDLKLLQRIPVSELFAIVRDMDEASLSAKLKFRTSFRRIRDEYNRSEMSLMSRDASASVRIEKNQSTHLAAGVEGHIFVTGGTGFFGPFLIYSLLEQTPDDIYVLVRAASPAEGLERLKAAFQLIHPTIDTCISFNRRVKAVCGDLAMPQLGLSPENREFISRHIHTIYHNGACVNYLMDYENMRSANVEGTREVIRLANSFRIKTLNYISTTFIFGWSAKDTLFEFDSNASMEYLDFGYSQSKWVCDQLVLSAIKQGLPARIFRPALISPSVNGHGYSFDISIRLLSFMLKYGIGTSAQNQVSFTPADIAANNIVAISGIASSVGLTFHVTRDEYASMPDVTQILSQLSGTSFRNFELKAFVPEVINRCNKQDLLFPLLNFLVQSVDNISAMEFKRYDNINYKKFRSMSALGKKDPSLFEVVNGIFLFMKGNPEICNDLNLEPSQAFSLPDKNRIIKA